MKHDTVVIYSGGMDSFTLVNEMHETERLHSCLSFNYGQRHRKELLYAQNVTAALKTPHRIVNLTAISVCLQGSALTTPGAAMPEGHYAEENMKQTVVPNRNAIMLSIAAAYAMSNQVSYLAFGAHAGDHTIYPDCREPFVEAINNVIAVGNWPPLVTVIAPYLHKDKTEILDIGFMLGLDYGQSWTCYAGEELACGKCGSCQERLEAFKNHGRKDPLEYAA